MSEVRDVNRQCRRKLRYDTPTDAKIGLVEHHGKRTGFNTYLCPHCEFWHVGHLISEEA